MTSSGAVAVVNGDERPDVHAGLAQCVVDLVKVGGPHALGSGQDPGQLCHTINNHVLFFLLKACIPANRTGSPRLRAFH